MERYTYKGGYFVNVGIRKWEEWQGNTKAYSFGENDRTPAWITLYDSRRKIFVSLPTNGGQSFFMWEGHPPWTPLYNMTPPDPKTVAEQDKTTSVGWIIAALNVIQGYEIFLQSGLPDLLGVQQFPKTALDVHFNLSKGPSGALVYLSTIKMTYSNIIGALNRSGQIFRSRTPAQAATDKGLDKNGIPYPAYTFYKSSINFTHCFLGYGPLGRAAMVLHETVHYVDNKATVDYYEHGPQYPKSGVTVSADQAIHNPSSFVAFGQHVFYGKDERFGAGRPKD
jgi:hypothetical protein